jgi:hypothetical protein
LAVVTVSDLSRDALLGQLRTLTEPDLAELGAKRRDLTNAPTPASLTELAERMLSPRSLLIAGALLNRPQLQLAEAVAALGDGWTTAGLAALIGVPETDPTLRTGLAELSAVGLIWPVGDGFAGDHLQAIWPHPLDLGAGYGEGGRMPREAAVALRGQDYHAPFDPEPPALATTPVAADAVARDAAAAAAETLTAITAVLESIRRTPLELLRTGGLGVREMRRLAKDAGQGLDRTRLSIELATSGGLTGYGKTGLTVSYEYTEYTAAEPGAQLLHVIGKWLRMPACPLAPPATERALVWDIEDERALTGLRTAFLRTVVAVVPPGRAVTSETMTAQLAWHYPRSAGAARHELDRFVTGIWREAHAIGLLAHGTPTDLCRLLRVDDGPAFRAVNADVRRAADTMAPATRDSVVLQNDLTAVVTGTPSVALLSLLDSVAVPESRSGGWTWRFSPASVRAALDADLSSDQLLARLRAVAGNGRVPQALTYLIEDEARRHGGVRVQAVGCCLCSDDEALLTEILHTRSLKALKLAQLAPTVLSSNKPQAATLAALRDAGFAPAGVRANGTAVIERLPQHRDAPAFGGWEPVRRTFHVRQVEPGEFAVKLMEARA